MEIDTEHYFTAIAANEPVDDLARDDLTLTIVTQPRLHLMADNGPDLNDFAFRRSAWYEHAWCRGGHCQPPLWPSDAAIGSHVDPGLGHQQRAVAHLGDRHDILWLGEANARRNAGDAALRDKVETGHLEKRVLRCEHADSPHMVVLGHRALDVELHGHGIAGREYRRHDQVQTVRHRRCLSGPPLDELHRFVLRAHASGPEKGFGEGGTSSTAGHQHIAACQAHGARSPSHT